MSYYEEGYAAWEDDIPLAKNPYQGDAADEWEAGWRAAESDHAQFGVGA